jgi:hypothetical protein
MSNPGDTVDGFLFVGDEPELIAAFMEQRVGPDGGILPGVPPQALELILAALDRAVASQAGARVWNRWSQDARKKTWPPAS